MNAVMERILPGRRDLPAAGWWALLAVAIGLHLTMPLGWAAGLGLVTFVVIQKMWPLEFLTSYLMVVAGSSVVDYTRGGLTLQLSILTGGLLFMLLCYFMERRERWLTIPHTPLTLPLLVFLGLSLMNYGRGLLVGNSVRYAGLEFLAVLGLVSSFTVGTKVFSQANIKASLVWLYIICLAHVGLGVYMYAVIRARSGGIWYTPVPGVAFALMLPMMLRARTTMHMVLWVLALSLLLLHQFLSFTRGYWFAIIITTVFTVLLYTGRGPGVGTRWKRAGTGLLLMVVPAAVLAVVFALSVGFTDILELAGTRFTSSTSTEMSWETGSNVVRLVEYFHVIDLILRNPIFGYGLGYWFVVREPIGWRLVEQWFVHQNYLLVTLKQGLIGLGVFIWVLLGAFRTGMKGRKLPEDWKASWCAGTAGASLYIAIYCNVHFPLAEVTTVFTIAFVWGVAMSMVRTGNTEIRWRLPFRGPAREATGAGDR